MLTLDIKVRRLIYDCRNTRLHILVALWGFRAAPTATDIARETGFERHTVADALANLETNGYVFHQGQRWQITDKGHPVLLPEIEKLLGEANFTEKDGGNPPLTTTTVLTGDRFLVTLSSSSSKNQNGGNPTILPEPEESPEYLEALASLHANNIKGPKAELLAGKEWMTPEYINQHIAQIRAEGNKLGLAIMRMEIGEEPRDLCDECGEFDGKHSGVCRHQREDGYRAVAEAWKRIQE